MIEFWNFVPGTSLEERRSLRLPAQRKSKKAEKRDQKSILFPYEYRTITGIQNNEKYPLRGSIESPLIRLVEADYTDGLSSPAGSDRPSAREVSNKLVDQSVDIPITGRASDFLWQWGQFLDHDIDLTHGATPPVPFNIKVPAGDPWFDPANTGTKEIELSRSTSEPDSAGIAQQINSITSFIDASNVYGSTEERANALRMLDGSGKLKTSESSTGPLLPFNLQGLENAGGPSPALFLAGDVRANEQAGLMSMHTLFVREHNYWAEKIASDDPLLSGDHIYEMARVIVGAEMQVITYREFLPLLLGKRAIPPYKGYKPEVDPSISNVFSTSAYRVGHTMLSSQLLRIGKNGESISEGPLPLKDAFFRPGEITSRGIEPILRGLAAQQPQQIDTRLVHAVRNFLFGPAGAGGFDLASLNIQRGRDHGLPDYNQIRKELGLPVLTDFSEYPEGEVGLGQKFQDVYGSIDNIDSWTGLLGEKTIKGALVGETLHAIFVDQFTRLRDGDRFWYENYLSKRLRYLVEKQKLSTVIKRNTDIEFIQDDVFRVRKSTGNPTNLLTNGGFENKLEGWETWGEVSLVENAGGTAASLSFSLLAQSIDIKKIHQTHCLSGQYQTTGSSKWMEVGLTYLDDEGKTVGEKSVVLSHSELYQPFELKAEVPKDAKSLALWIWAEDGGQLNLDNLFLESERKPIVVPPFDGPSVKLSTALDTFEGPFSVVAKFSDQVKGLDSSDFIIENGTVIGLSSTPDGSYFVTVAPAKAGRVSIVLPEGVVKNATGKPNSKSNSLSVIYTTGTIPSIPSPESLWLTLGAQGASGQGVPVGFTAPFIEPVVFASIEKQINHPPMVVRLSSVSAAGARVKLERLDGSNEEVKGVRVHLLVTEPGVYTIADHGISMEIGSVNVAQVSGYWTNWDQGAQVALSQSYGNPVVIGQVQTSNSQKWTQFWSRGSDVTLAVSGADSEIVVGHHIGEDPDTWRETEETIAYAVIESGKGNFMGIPTEAGTALSNLSGGISPSYILSDQTNILTSISGMKDFNGAIPAVNIDTAASSFQILVQEDQLNDQETKHEAETVGYFIVGGASS